jgi:hypothetical protein
MLVVVFVTSSIIALDSIGTVDQVIVTKLLAARST